MFARIATVLQRPRCLNCHTVTDFPRQDDDRHAHVFAISRGPDDRECPTDRCTSCHDEANNDVTGVPGRPDWQLAPLRMGWEGLSPAQLYRRLLDPGANGHRTPQQIAEHIAGDRQFVATTMRLPSEYLRRLRIATALPGTTSVAVMQQACNNHMGNVGSKEDHDMASDLRKQWQNFKKKHPDFEKSKAFKSDVGPQLDKFDAARDKCADVKGEVVKLGKSVAAALKGYEAVVKELAKSDKSVETDFNHMNFEMFYETYVRQYER